MSKRVKTRKATDDIDRIGIAVLELFADGAAEVSIVRKGKSGEFRYECWAAVQHKVKAHR
jgi:hypothetical protein